MSGSMMARRARSRSIATLVCFLFMRFMVIQKAELFGTLCSPRLDHSGLAYDTGVARGVHTFRFVDFGCVRRRPTFVREGRCAKDALGCRNQCFTVLTGW